MGVDIEMFVLPAKPLTDVERRKTSAELVKRVGADWFWIARPEDENPLGKQDRHALMAVSPPTADPDDEDEGDYVLEMLGLSEYPDGLLTVSTFGRYYGRGYERGSWLNIKATAEILEHLLPGCKIWYGGDGSAELDIFDSAARDTMHAHWLAHGHEPYRGYRGPWKMEPVEHCDHCGGIDMHDVGGGGGDKFWHCDGCGNKLILTANGQKVPVPAGKDFFEIHRGLHGH